MWGIKTPDYLSRLVCLGTGAALIFQICVNVGMCLGVVPVIGLTLPFISYGGGSIVSLYLAMGVVSSVHAHPGQRPEAGTCGRLPRLGIEKANREERLEDAGGCIECA